MEEHEHQRQSPDDCLWLTKTGDHRVATVGLHHDSPEQVRLCRFRLDPEWQHTSIPRTLAKEVRTYCGEQGCAKLVARAGDCPAWFRGLLERSGFHREEPADATASMFEYSLTPAADSGVLRVLLADDHPVQRRGMAELLREQGKIAVIGEAGDGQQAVDLALETHPDVVLMDVTMPGMDGIEATRQIVSRLPQVRVIGLSVHEEDSTAKAMLRAGASMYVRKGSSAGALIAAVLTPA